jgi:isoleucyl-tRNA synthetase
VLETLTRSTAPLLPMLSEEIWRGLTGGRSVHLADWPDTADLPGDPDLVTAMDRARDVASATLGLRKTHALRVRQPLSTLTVVLAEPDTLRPFETLLTDEVNVKAIRLVPLDSDEASGLGVTRQLTVNARAAGPRLGKQVQTVIRASKSGDWTADADGAVVCGAVALQEGEFTLRTVVAASTGEHRAVAMLPGGGFVVLDTDLTVELSREGLARDLIRSVQQLRRDAGLSVGERIRLTVRAVGEPAAAVTGFVDLIAAETLAVDVSLAAPGTAGSAASDGEATLGDGSAVGLAVERVNAP